MQVLIINALHRQCRVKLVIIIQLGSQGKNEGHKGKTSFALHGSCSWCDQMKGSLPTSFTLFPVDGKALGLPQSQPEEQHSRHL